MRYAQIRSLDVSNGLGVGVALFTQGCPFHCPGCFNPETWDMNGGIKYTSEHKDTILRLIEPDYIVRFSILGGESLIPRNFYPIADLIQCVKLKRPDIKIWIYSGYTYEELQKIAINNLYLSFILMYIDVLVDGPFIQELKDISLPFCGSRNQRIIDIPKTLAKGEIVLLEV